MKYGLQIKMAIVLAINMAVQSAVAQENPTFDKMVDFLPPAPNAAAITKYGEASVNRNTGTPNISIPLFALKGTKLSTNISLGYSSNGIKVDEIASRVGMGWAINAGGVITRTLRGVPDETNTRHYPYAPITTNWATYNYMKRIAQSQNNWGYNNGFDAEPDLFNFSFDGYSGSFVFNGSGYAQVNKAGIKIETDFTGTATWNFRITTPDGVKYLFGGATATEKTKREQTCGKSYTDYLTTSWYLKEIQHPNGEKIQFTYIAHTYQYDNGVSQTMYFARPVFGTGCENSIPVIPTSTCTNITKTVGVLLSTIESQGKALISFDYVSRDDCQDKLISKITYKDPVNIVSSVDFTYTTITAASTYNNEYYLGQNKTPYLTSLTENSSDNALHKTHYFSYIDPEGRPSRLSFSQDHWGYFNGKINTSFTPYMGINYVQQFPAATANRNPEFAYAQKGLLRKIVYPTGGTTTLFYEPNTYNNGTPDMYSTLHKLSCDVTGSGAWVQESKSKTFHSDLTQIVELTIQCRDNSGNGSFDPTHNKGSVQLKDVNTGLFIFNEVYNPGFSGTIYAYLPNPNHDYQLILTANGTIVTTLATLKYYPAVNNSLTAENIAGGMRVQKIATANPGDNPMIKKYYYGTLDNLNQSSMAYIAKPRYVGFMKKPGTCAGLAGPYVYDYSTLNSSSLFSLGYFNNGLVGYHSVVESIGENFEGGATESQFNVNSDALGQVLWNNDIINSPFTNFSSFYNGKPHKETVVKKMASGNLVPIKRTEYTYINEPAGENEVYGYSIVEKVPDYDLVYDTTCDPTVNPGSPLSCLSNVQRGLGLYDMVRYSVFSSFVHPDQQIETIWDENGQNPLVTTKQSFFDNLQNYQLTRSEITNSKNELIRSTNKYPHDYAGTTVYDDMISKNIIGSLVNAKSEIVNTPGPNTVLSEQQIDYANKGNNNYVPAVIKKSVKGNALSVEGTIDLYDDNGNILQFTNKAGLVTSIIWGYNYQYPVAQVVASTYSNSIAQLSVTVASLQTMDGTALQTELNRIRTNLPNARVTTYTYKHLAGVSTITDPNNKTNTYQYDAFNRLMLIKDQDGNAVKKNDYVYITPDPNTGLTIYFNQAVSQDIQCNTCSVGFTGNLVNYTVPAGKYYSLSSQTDADQKATTDIATIGQEYANRNGFCSNSITCTQPGYKFVSCGCELGQKICEYVQADPNNPGAWFTHAHFLWSDGSTSPSFTNYIESCSGADKKIVNCACETGVRVCDGTPVNNGGGSYTVSYHYHFSDNTNSSTITETISCSGNDKKIINCACETGVKFYISSVLTNKFSNNGCAIGQWLCTYYYRWSDNSTSANYTECSATDCGPTE